MTMLLLLTALACAMERRPFPQMEPVRECVICLEGVSPGQITCCPGGQCKAAFHRQCLMHWCARFPEGIEPCPMCRHGMPAPDHEKYAEAEEELEALEREIERIRVQRREVENRIANQQALCDVAADELAQAEQELAVEQQNTEALDREIARQQIELEEAKLEDAKLTEELHEADSELDTLQRQQDAAAAEMERLNKELAEIEQEESAAQLKSDRINDEVDHASAAVDQALDRTNDAIKDHERVKDELAAENDALRQALREVYGVLRDGMSLSHEDAKAQMMTDPDFANIEEKVQSFFDELEEDISSDSDSDLYGSDSENDMYE